MKQIELKNIIVQFLNEMIDQWFDDNMLLNGIAKTIVKANMNKYDNIIDMVTDNNGNVLINELLDNIGDSFIGDGIRIDLRQYNNLFPNRILLFDKNDFQHFKNKLLKRMD